MQQYRIVFTEFNADGTNEWVHANDLTNSEVQDVLDEFEAWRNSAAAEEYDISDPRVEVREITPWTPSKIWS